MAQFAYVAYREMDWEGPDIDRESSRVFLSEQAAIDYCEEIDERFPEEYAHMEYSIIPIVQE